MEDKASTTTAGVFKRLWRNVVSLSRSDMGGKAKTMAAVLIILIICINAMNVINSFVTRFLMSSIERRDTNNFVFYAWLCVGVFAGSTAFAVLYRFTEQRLALLWRDWLTRRVIGIYLMRGLYRSLAGDEVSNPDQRIAEDVRSLTSTTVSIVLMLLNSTITAISFAGVLWGISPELFVVSVSYAALGSLIIVHLGRPLIHLNYAQSDREAEFRGELLHVRENAAQIAEAHSEPVVQDVLASRLDSIVENLKRIIALNRTLDFFATGYNYMIQIVPIVIVAPHFINKGVDFGIISQSAMAFTTMVNAFSLIVTQFQSFSGYASVVTRLNEFAEAADREASNHK